MRIRLPSSSPMVSSDFDRSGDVTAPAFQTVRQGNSSPVRYSLARMKIGVLGATGPAGSGLAIRLASVGFEVIIGSRSKYRAMEVRDGLVMRWESRNLEIGAADNAGAAAADVVVLATPWDAAAATAMQVAPQLRARSCCACATP